MTSGMGRGTRPALLGVASLRISFLFTSDDEDNPEVGERAGLRRFRAVSMATGGRNINDDF
jgi:hypothetical protein